MTPTQEWENLTDDQRSSWIAAGCEYSRKLGCAPQSGVSAEDYGKLAYEAFGKLPAPEQLFGAEDVELMLADSRTEWEKEQLTNRESEWAKQTNKMLAVRSVLDVLSSLNLRPRLYCEGRWQVGDDPEPYARAETPFAACEAYYRLFMTGKSDATGENLGG